MSDISMSRMLLDLQRVAKQAQTSAPDPSGAAGAAQGAQGFGDLMKQAVLEVNNAQKTAAKLKSAFEVGAPGVDLPQVMVASQKASVAFDSMLEVRKHLLKAYQDIMSMQV